MAADSLEASAALAVRQFAVLCSLSVLCIERVRYLDVRVLFAMLAGVRAVMNKFFNGAIQDGHVAVCLGIWMGVDRALVFDQSLGDSGRPAPMQPSARCVRACICRLLCPCCSWCKCCEMYSVLVFSHCVRQWCTSFFLTLSVDFFSISHK